MSVRSISIEAYEHHQRTGKALTQWMKILKFLRTNRGSSYTRSEISETLRIRMSSVCGRVKELLDAGLVQESERRFCSVTNEQAHPIKWRAHAPVQERLI